MNLVVAGGFVTAPLVSVISGSIEMNRVMFVLPFAALVATYGALTLWEARSALAKVAAVLLVVSIFVQFNMFYRGYMSEAYRTAAASWFSGNVREALRELIGRAGDADVYVSADIEWVHRMWRFYAIEAGRLDLMSRTTYFTDPPATVAPGAKLLCLAGSARCSSIQASGAWHEVIRIPAIGGSRVFLIFERTAANKTG